MDVTEAGPGDPVVTVMGGIHGDEPCGPRAIRRVREAAGFQRGVRFIVANEPALDRGVRAVDTDLNRAFTDPGGAAHEQQLAAALQPHVRDQVVVDLHSTRASDRPHAMVHGIDTDTAGLVRDTGLDTVVDVSDVIGGTLIAHCRCGVAVECGRTGTTEATETAERVVRRVLAARGVIDGPVARSDPAIYRLTGTVSGAGYRFTARNFEQVAAGEPFARDADGAPVVADEPFYPVLMSTDGYTDRLGYTADRVGLLSDYVKD